MPIRIVCLGCRRVVLKSESVKGRCATCRGELVAETRAFKRYDDSSVKSAMREAVRRAGRCQACGATGVTLHAHLPGGGAHVADWRVYVVLDERCHPRLEAAERAV